MSAARDLALLVKELVPRAAGMMGVDWEGFDDLLQGADAVLNERAAPGPFKTIEERAHEMWIVAASSGEIRIGPSVADVVRTIRAMDAEIATPTPFPPRQQAGPGLNSFSGPPDPLADY